MRGLNVIKSERLREFLFVYTAVILAAAVTMMDMDSCLLISAAAVPAVAAVALNAIKNQNWLYLCFYALSAEVYYVMVLCIYGIKGTETSWRFVYARDEYNEVSLRFIMISLMLLSLVYLFFLYGRDNFFKEEKTEFNVSRFRGMIFIAVYAVILLYYAVMTPAMGMRLYSSTPNIMILSLLRVCCLLGWVLLPKAQGDMRKLLTAECFVGALITTLLALNGYRFILFENVIMIAILNLSRLKKIKLSTWAVMIVFVIIFYILLTVLKARLAGRELAGVVFSHEKNLFYSLNAIIANMGSERLETYLSTLKNLLPKALTGSRDLNTGGMLMKYINYEMFLQNSVTMGGYYLTEAYANLHEAGVYIVSLAFGIFFALLERRRSSGKACSVLFISIYYGFIAQSYTFVYYGSSNYVKFLVYYILFAFVILLPVSTAAARFRKKKRQI